MTPTHDLYMYYLQPSVTKKIVHIFQKLCLVTLMEQDASDAKKNLRCLKCIVVLYRQILSKG